MILCFIVEAYFIASSSSLAPYKVSYYFSNRLPCLNFADLELHAHVHAPFYGLLNLLRYHDTAICVYSMMTACWISSYTNIRQHIINIHELIMVILNL